jgi:type IV secretory pathway TraG/TraD family ATPase VirD4
VCSSDLARSFVTGQTTLSMEAMATGGKILVVHVSDAKYPRLARILHTLIKRAGQAAVRRHVGKRVPTLFLIDEFHTIFSAGPGADADFFSLSRESNHANIIACQNIPLFYQSSRNTHEVHSLLGNCATQIFLRNDEPSTNEYASGLFGEMATITLSQSEPARFGDILKRNHASYSRGSSSVRIAAPSAFATLRVPDRNDPEAFYAEAIVHLGARPERQGCTTLLWPVQEG